MDFVGKAPHPEVMNVLSGALKETRLTRWTVTAGSIPPPWKDALRNLDFDKIPWRRLDGLVACNTHIGTCVGAKRPCILGVGEEEMLSHCDEATTTKTMPFRLDPPGRWRLRTTSRSSTHRRHSIRADLIYDADLAGLPVGICIETQILLGQPTDVLISAALGSFHHLTANREIAVWIVRIVDLDRDTRIAPDAPVFDPSLRDVEPHVSPIEVEPHRGHLRCPIRHDRGQMAECLLLEKIAEVLRNLGVYRRQAPSLV